MPKKILILDSSQIDAFDTCPFQWNYEYRERLVPVNAGENVPMDMGTYGHKLLEIIYKERSKGNEKNAVETAFNYNVDQETCRCSHGKERHLVSSEPESSIDNFPCTSKGCPCKDFEGISFPLSAPDRQFVRDRVLEYTFAEGSLNSGIPILVPKSENHVEVGFSHKLFEDDKRLWILEGRVDLIGQIAPNVEEGWADHKFQSRERDLYLKSIQFRNYSLVLQRPLGVVNYIRFAKKFEKSKTFKRAVISFTRQEMRDWEEELLDIYHRVELFLERQERNEVEKSDRHWSSCSGKFGYPCDYVKLCNVHRQPELVQLLKASEFKKKAEWRPW